MDKERYLQLVSCEQHQVADAIIALGHNYMDMCYRYDDACSTVQYRLQFVTWFAVNHPAIADQVLAFIVFGGVSDGL